LTGIAIACWRRPPRSYIPWPARSRSPSSAHPFWFATVAGPRLRNLERTPWASIVVAEGDAGEHRAVAVDGPATIARQPSEQLLAGWEARHGSRAEWAAAWFEIQPARLISFSAKNEP
jgi:hypothetical protein